MENAFYLNRFKVRYVKNKSLFPSKQEIVATCILAKDKAEASRYQF